MRVNIGKRTIISVWLIRLLTVVVTLTIAGGALLYWIWNAHYPKTENSFFTSDFVQNRKVLVIVPHQDDEMNLAYGVIDSFVAGGSDVVVVFATNGDREISADKRVAEAVACCALMGVPEENIILLGYGDHIVNPSFYQGAPDEIRVSDAGHSQTYGAYGIPDYHKMRFGEFADYTWLNLKNDIKQVILDFMPDVIIANDTDYHPDHVTVSQLFDRAMGEILHEQTKYRPKVFKGFAYEFAWHGNDDFSGVPLRSAAYPWVWDSYETAYPWAERVRIPMHPDYLSYTLRSSKLHSLLRTYVTQDAIDHQTCLLNSDKVYWERRTDACYGTVSASSGEASLLNDFLIAGTYELPLYNAWFPDVNDSQPEIRFAWDAPQTFAEIVFYAAPSHVGDVVTVEVSIPQTDDVLKYTLTDNSGKPCRLPFAREGVREVVIHIVDKRGDAGLMEIEFLPPRDETPQWIKVMDENGDFCTIISHPEDQPLILWLYGYPAVPTQAEVTLAKNGNVLAGTSYHDGVLDIPPLSRGSYRISVAAGDCYDEVILSVGDRMILPRGIQWLERMLESVLP